MPIRIRLTLWYTSLLGIILIAFGALLYFVLNFSLHAQIDYSLQDRAQQVINEIQARAFFDKWTRQIVIPQANVFSSPATFIQVIQADGSVVTASDNLKGEDIPVDSGLLAANLQGKPSSITVTLHNIPVRIYSAPIILDNQVDATIGLQNADIVLSKRPDGFIEFQIDAKVNAIVGQKFSKAGIPVVAENKKTFLRII